MQIPSCICQTIRLIYIQCSSRKGPLELSPPYPARLSQLPFRLVSFRSCFRLFLFRSPYPAPPERLRIGVSKGPSAGGKNGPHDRCCLCGVFFIGVELA